MKLLISEAGDAGAVRGGKQSVSRVLKNKSQNACSPRSWICDRSVRRPGVLGAFAENWVCYHQPCPVAHNHSSSTGSNTLLWILGTHTHIRFEEMSGKREGIPNQVLQLYEIGLSLLTPDNTACSRERASLGCLFSYFGYFGKHDITPK